MQIEERIEVWKLELARARGFVPYAPHDAVARARIVLRELDEALAHSDRPRYPPLDDLRVYAASCLGRYEADFAAFEHEAAQRSLDFASKELDALSPRHALKT